MAEGKKSFVLYADQRGIFDKLDNEQAGKLIKHIYAYVNDENPKGDFVTDLAFESIKTQLKRDLKRWQSEKEKKSNAGILGNLKRYNVDLYKAVQDNAMTISEAQKVAKGRGASFAIADLAVNVNDNVNVNVNDNVKKNIEDRKEDFKKSLHPFLDKYSKSLILDFYEYWTEHGEKDKKMRFEKEKSFGLSRRLSNWHKRQKSFDSKEKPVVYKPLELKH